MYVYHGHFWKVPRLIFGGPPKKVSRRFSFTAARQAGGNQTKANSAQLSWDWGWTLRSVSNAKGSTRTSVGPTRLLIVATSFCLQRPSAAHELRSDQFTKCFLKSIPSWKVSLAFYTIVGVYNILRSGFYQISYQFRQFWINLLKLRGYSLPYPSKLKSGTRLNLRLQI